MLIRTLPTTHLQIFLKEFFISNLLSKSSEIETTILRGTFECISGKFTVFSGIQSLIVDFFLRSMTEHQVIEIGLNLCCKFEGTIKLHLINSISHVCCFSPMLLHIVNEGRNCFYIT